MVQEHWLTPANLNKFDKFPNYFTFGCSAMSKAVESGMLKGRPFGGVMTMVKNELRKLTETIYCSDRCSIIRVANIILVNVYLPCTPTPDRLIICQDLMANIWSWCDQYPQCQYIIAGDFNVNLDGFDAISGLINDTISEHSLFRCDVLFSKSHVATYVNTALNHQSTIDYVLTSSNNIVNEYVILDPDINFSDHLPIMATCQCVVPATSECISTKSAADTALPVHFRWDHADLIGYYRFTGLYLQPLLDNLRNVVNQFSNHQVIDVGPTIDMLYDDIVNILATAAEQFVPQRSKTFYKFWWDEEMDILKQNSIDSNKIWKNAGELNLAKNLTIVSRLKVVWTMTS